MAKQPPSLTTKSNTYLAALKQPQDKLPRRLNRHHAAPKQQGQYSHEAKQQGLKGQHAAPKQQGHHNPHAHQQGQNSHHAAPKQPSQHDH